jgi:hypothetical protein
MAGSDLTAADIVAYPSLKLLLRASRRPEAVPLRWALMASNTVSGHRYLDAAGGAAPSLSAALAQDIAPPDPSLGVCRPGQDCGGKNRGFARLRRHEAYRPETTARTYQRLCDYYAYGANSQTQDGCIGRDGRCCIGTGQAANRSGGLAARRRLEAVRINRLARPCRNIGLIVDGPDRLARRRQQHRRGVH